MRGYLYLGGILGLLAGIAVAIRRGGEILSMGGPGGRQHYLREMADQARGEMQAFRRDLMGRLDHIESELSSRRAEPPRIQGQVEEIKSEVETMQRDVLSRMDQTRSELESMERQMMVRLDDIRSQMARAAEHQGERRGEGEEHPERTRAQTPHPGRPESKSAESHGHRS